MKSEQINEIAKALSVAQAKITGAIKDTQNPHYKSFFADLASVMDAIRTPFAESGLSYTQTTRITENGGVVLVTTVMHHSGQWLAGEYPVIPIKNDPQGLGSAMTYARRYTLSAVAGVAQVDDDGEAAMGRNKDLEKGKENLANKLNQSKPAMIPPNEKTQERQGTPQQNRPAPVQNMQPQAQRPSTHNSFQRDRPGP
jgi:hypothetical protein